MKKLLSIVTFIVAVFVMASCTSPKDILYFQDIDQATIDNLPSNYEALIKKDDRLTIVVSGPDKSVIAPYNLSLSENSTNYNSNYLLTYLVDKDGYIDFPVLGKIFVEGMTRNQLAKHLKDEISKDVKDPVIYVSFANYKITILGAVKGPGTYTFDSEKVTLLQALSRAGDLNISGLREVLLIREEDGKLTYNKLDLRNSNVLGSPYYYLQQNDILYIPPSTSRIILDTNSGIWAFGVSVVTSLIAVFGLIFK